MEKNRQYQIISSDDLLSIAEKVVVKYMYRGAIPMRDKEDVVSGIVEKFLISQDKISQAFKGDSKTSTYCIAIVNRMCCEIIRRDFKRWNEVNNEEPDIRYEGSTQYLETSKKVIIQSEIDRFNKILEFFNDEKAKVSLFLKFILGINIRKKDVNQYLAINSDELFKQLQNSVNASLANRYQLLADLVNNYENNTSEIKGDAVRMWLNKKVDAIVNRMNGNRDAYYDRESLSILMEMIED